MTEPEKDAMYVKIIDDSTGESFGGAIVVGTGTQIVANDRIYMFEIMGEAACSEDIRTHSLENDLTSHEKWLKIKEQKAFRKMCKRGK
jgi:hypothetical protein